MGEADWWLCTRCSSLNNLSAGKCYSCRQRKPKGAVRASEYLGYEPVVSWDGKVSLRQLPIERAREEPGEASPPPVAPLRDPVPRDTLAVAPRPPNPARITYRPERPPDPMPAPWVSPVGPSAGVGPASPLGPAGPGVPASGIGPPIGPNARPLVAAGPGPAAAPDDAEPWPHWRQLLEGPTPHAERLRMARSWDEEDSGDLDARTTQAAGKRGGRSLSQALQQSRGDSPSRTFIPWPEADRPEQGTDGGGEDTGSRSLVKSQHVV